MGGRGVGGVGVGVGGWWRWKEKSRMDASYVNKRFTKMCLGKKYVKYARSFRWKELSD